MTGITLPAASQEINGMQLVDTAQAASLLGLRAQTLAKHRVLGTGCRFVRLGRRIFYRLSDLRAWIDANTCNSTSESAASSSNPVIAGGQSDARES